MVNVTSGSTSPLISSLNFDTWLEVAINMHTYVYPVLQALKGLFSISLQNICFTKHVAHTKSKYFVFISMFAKHTTQWRPIFNVMRVRAQVRVYITPGIRGRACRPTRSSLWWLVCRPNVIVTLTKSRDFAMLLNMKLYKDLSVQYFVYQKQRHFDCNIYKWLQAE